MRFRIIDFFLVSIIIGLLEPNLDAQTSVRNNDGLKWAKDMADAEIQRNPEPWNIDFVKKPLWNYTQGFVVDAIQKLWLTTADQRYFDYGLKFANTFVKEDGSILTYDVKEYSLDKINPGKVLFLLNHRFKADKYGKALKLLRSQLLLQPRTAEKGFWHKQRYPNQMWLDGIYMASPFLVQYAIEFKEPLLFEDVSTQIKVIQKHTLDTLSGLNFHGWDESHLQKWANAKTGCSPNIWGRAEGWYFMALADVLESLPINAPGQDEVLKIFQQLAVSLIKVQDTQTGCWFQVLDKAQKPGNYLESSASCMFVYGLAKGVRLGFLPKEYQQYINKGFQGITKQFIRLNPDKSISITKACSVAGLGGKPYRDGSFNYYISEPIRDDDPKAVGAFIMAALEYSKINDSSSEKTSPTK